MSTVAWGRGGKLVTVWGLIYWDVSEEEGDWFSDSIAILGGLITTSYMLAPQFSYGATGVVTRAIVTNPYVQIVTGAAVVGAVVSNEIDPESGLDNYLGFTTGGHWGTAEPNYYSGDPNDSGYFNVWKNTKTIWEHYKKERQSTRPTKPQGVLLPPQLRHGNR